MNEHNDQFHTDSLAQDSYETGSTTPPKRRGLLLTISLISAILLFGIFSALTMLNVNLLPFRGQYSGNGNLLNFHPASFPYGTTPALKDIPIPVPNGSGPSITLHKPPEAVENIPQAGGLSLQAIYEKNIPSVVSISCTTTEGAFSGTGVVLSQDGYLITNSHVVENAQTITVLLTNGQKLPAAVIGQDPMSDLAVLYVQADNLTPAEFGDSSTLRVGDTVVAIGDPLGIELRGTMTDGIVSAINRDIVNNGWTMSLIQTNAALNSGNSGGPLINCFGQVIGINAMKIGTFVDSAGVEGLGFAIPSVTVKDVAEQLIANGFVSGRPYVGAKVQEVSPYYQNYYQLPSGLLVLSTEADSPAAKAGLASGDVITGLNQTRITSMEEMNAALYSHKPGDTITLSIYRDRKTFVLELTLGQKSHS